MQLHHVTENDTIFRKNVETICCKNNISDEIKQIKEDVESFKRNIEIIDSIPRNGFNYFSFALNIK